MTGRDRIVVLVVGVVAIIAAAWLMVISPKRDQAAKLQSQINGVKSDLSTAQSQLAQGEAARQAFRASYATLVRLGEAVPTDDNVPSLIYEVQSAASKAGVQFLGLTLTPSGATGTPNINAPASPSTTPGSTPSASSTTTPSSSAPASTPASTTPPATPTPTTATSGTTAAPTLPPGAVVGPAGFPIEPFTFTFQGDFFHLANFFARLQRFVVATGSRLAVSGRLLNLDAINLGPAPGGFPQITATVSATTYLLPATEGLVDGATSAGPAASTSAPASSTPATSAAPAPAVVTAGGGG